jgi:predicted nucleic-acid-binding Zn-ribbon protein
MPTIKKVAKALKQAATAFGPGEYSIADKAVQCPHCGGRTFEMGQAQLNKALSTFFKLDWLDETATILVCTQCSQIQWFGKQPTRV